MNDRLAAVQIAIQSVSQDEENLELSPSVRACTRTEMTSCPLQEWQFVRSNVISRNAHVSGAQNVTIAGNSIVRPGVRIDGDLEKVRLGRYCDVGRDAVLRPPGRLDSKGETTHIPVAIGSHVQIGNGAVVEAAWIGVGVRIGSNAVIGKSTVIKDYCVVAADSVVPEDSVLAPLSIVSGDSHTHTHTHSSSFCRLSEIQRKLLDTYRLVPSR